jgi:putative type II restriction enzyme hphI
MFIFKGNIMPELKIFKDEPNDAEYLKWRENNPDGYILNINKEGKPISKYPMIHRVQGIKRKPCISNENGNYTTESSPYYKACSNSIPALEAYSRQKYNKRLTGCGHCMEDYVPSEYIEIPTFQVAYQQSLENDLDELSQRLENATTEEAKTEIQRLINARRGQGEFRNGVLERYPQCPISGVDMPELLIASHIKPWRDCKDDEEWQRLDPYNGLMLAPNIDALFDSGLITFESDGKIRISKRLSEKNLFRLGISLDAVLEIHPDSEKYFEWHRNKVFKP